MNNLSFVAVNSSAKVLCGDFHMEHWVGSILFFNVSFSFFVRIAHSAFLLNVPFTIRMIITSVMYLLGFYNIFYLYFFQFFFFGINIFRVDWNGKFIESRILVCLSVSCACWNIIKFGRKVFYRIFELICN